MKKSTYKRLTVHLFNAEHKNNFKNTYTYENIENEFEAARVIWDMHASVTDNNHDMSRKVIKAYYNGKPLNIFNQDKAISKNGWVLKEA